MRLTKPQRAELFARFDGRCAYCGHSLGERWHADHVVAVRREWHIKGGGFERPENDHVGNLMPSCPPCNIDKHAMTLEEWRQKLGRSCEVLTRNEATYRHAVRFGLVQEIAQPIVFHFEKAAP